MVKFEMQDGGKEMLSSKPNRWLLLLGDTISVSDRLIRILGDPGADSGGEGKSKQAGKYGTKEK